LHLASYNAAKSFYLTPSTGIVY